MTRRDLLAYVAAGGTALATSGCTTGASGIYRFRMTVRVDTPTAMKTGSSVYEVEAGHKRRLTAEEGSRYLWSQGEAVAVDIAPGKVLFALLATSAGQGDVSTMSMSAMDPAFHNEMPESAARIANRRNIKSPAVIGPSDYPLLITFRDLSKPNSLIEVDPHDLPAVFGEGVRLRAVEVEVTDDPVTTGLTARLPWLDRLTDFQKDPTNPFTSGLSNEIGYLRNI